MSQGNLNQLTPTKCKRATYQVDDDGKPKNKTYSDGGGLYIQCQPNGKKLWRMRYIVLGQTRLASFGQFPAIDLDTARELRDKVTRMAKKDLDYNAERKAKIEAVRREKEESFQWLAELWLKRMKPKWTERHLNTIKKSFESDVYPFIGHMYVGDIDAPTVLDVAERVADRGAQDMARRVLRRVSAVMRYATVKKDANEKPLIKVSPAVGLAEFLPEDKKKRKGHPALKWQEMPDFLTALETTKMFEQTKLALRLLMLTVVRTGELRFAKWDEFDLERKEWKIPAERMKMDSEHTVPLSEQAVSVLEQLKPLACGSDFVLPGRSSLDKPISENTILYRIYDMGYKGRMTGHGFRKVFSSWANQDAKFQLEGRPHPYNPDGIERQLAHGEPNKVRDAYLKADFMGERELLMQAWADQIDVWASSEKVVPLKRKKKA